MNLQGPVIISHPRLFYLWCNVGAPMILMGVHGQWWTLTEKTEICWLAQIRRKTSDPRLVVIRKRATTPQDSERMMGRPNCALCFNQVSRDGVGSFNAKQSTSPVRTPLYS